MMVSMLFAVCQVDLFFFKRFQASRFDVHRLTVTVHTNDSTECQTQPQINKQLEYKNSLVLNINWSRMNVKVTSKIRKFLFFFVFII